MTRELKQLLVDLIKLAPDDDHGIYPSDAIDKLRARAERFLVDGVADAGDELPLRIVEDHES